MGYPICTPPYYSTFTTITPPSYVSSPTPYGYGYSSHYNHEQQPPLPYSQPQSPPSYSPTPCFTHGNTPPSPNQYTSSSNPYTPLASLYSQFQPLPPSSPPHPYSQALPPPYSGYYNHINPYSQPAGAYQHPGAPYQPVLPLAVQSQPETSLTTPSITNPVSSSFPHPQSVSLPSPPSSKTAFLPQIVDTNTLPSQLTSPQKPDSQFTKNSIECTTAADHKYTIPPPRRPPPKPSELSTTATSLFIPSSTEITLPARAPPLKPPPKLPDPSFQRETTMAPPPPESASFTRRTGSSPATESSFIRKRVAISPPDSKSTPSNSILRKFSLSDLQNRGNQLSPTVKFCEPLDLPQLSREQTQPLGESTILVQPDLTNETQPPSTRHTTTFAFHEFDRTRSFNVATTLHAFSASDDESISKEN